MKYYGYFLWLCCALLFVTACKKNDPAPDRTALLTAKEWKVNQVKLNNNALDQTTIQQILGQGGLDVLDLLYNSNILFKTNGTYTATDRNTGAISDGTWEWNSVSNRTYLNITAQAQIYDFELLTLTESILSVSRPFTYNFLGTPVSGTVQLNLIPAQ